MTLEIELADGTVDTFDDGGGDYEDETYFHRIDDNEDLVVLKARLGAAGPGPEQEAARYPKDTWRSVRETN